MPDTAIDFSVLDSVQPGQGCIQVQFAPEAHGDLVYIIAMFNHGVLEPLTPSSHRVNTLSLMGWGEGVSRSMRFVPGPNWSKHVFMSYFRRVLESLEVDHSY